MSTEYNTLISQIAAITHRADLAGQMPLFVEAANELITVRLSLVLETPTDSNDANAILVEYPNLYLYASLISAYEFINELDMATHYVDRFNNEVSRYYITATGRTPSPVMGGDYTEVVESPVAPVVPTPTPDPNASAVFNTVAEMTAAGGFELNELVQCLDYAAGNNAGLLSFRSVAVGTGTQDGGSFIDGIGVQWQQLFTAGTVTVKQFGATGDGSTNDAGAFIAAFNYLRAAVSQVEARSLLMTLKIPPGGYRCDRSINATNINGNGWTVEGAGAVIYGYDTGFPVIDFFGSRFGAINNLTIYGDESALPPAGIAIGRNGTGNPAGGMSLTNVCTRGHYSIAGLYNYAAETSRFINCDLRNSDPSQDSYCLAQDGTYKLACPSTFVAMPAGEVPESFNENVFVGLVAAKMVSGPAIYMRRCSRHNFITGYGVSYDRAVVVMDSDSYGSFGNYFDLHCETTGLQSCFEFLGAATQKHRSFTFIDHAPYCENQVFKIDAAITDIAFIASNVSIHSFGATLSDSIFEPSAVVDYAGSMYLGNGSEYKAAVAREVSSLQLQDMDEAAYGRGTQTITSETNSDITVKGTYRFFGSTESQIGPGLLAQNDSTVVDGLSGLRYFKPNSSGGTFRAGQIDSAVIDNTAGAEDTELLLDTRLNGVANIASISVGVGAPTHTPSTQTGLYLRRDGTTTTSLYVWDGATWTAK